MHESTTGDWRDKANCLTEDPELFFPVGNAAPAKRQAEKAKAVCLKCEVKDECLEWAFNTGQDHGVWGGMTEQERRKDRRDRRRLGRASLKAS